jgi:hypothetical protein
VYNKLFAKILDSSIWLESDATRIVWLMFIAVMDEQGFCQFASVANVAHRARVTLGNAEEAIHTLEAPDPNSGDSEHEGRRVERVPGGWMVLNADKYRAIVTRATVQEQTRERVRRHRAKGKSAPENGPPSDGNADSNAKVTPSYSYSVSDTDTKNKIKSVSSSIDESAQSADAETTRNGALAAHRDVFDAGGSVPALEASATSQNGPGAATALARLPAISEPRTVQKVVERIALVNAELLEGARTRLANQQRRELMAEMVFAYWALKHGHQRALFDVKRRNRIVSRLEENDEDVGELFYAVDGALSDRAIQGRMPGDDGAAKYDGIETIFRDRAQVERLASLKRNYRAGAPHPMVEKYAAAFRDDVDVETEVSARYEANEDSTRA